MRHSARQCEHAIVDADPITRTRLCENVVRSVRLQADLRSRPLKSIVRIAVFRAICRVRLKPDTTYDGCVRKGLCENVVRSVRLQADLASRPLKNIARIAVFRPICRSPAEAGHYVRCDVFARACVKTSYVVSAFRRTVCRVR